MLFCAHPLTTVPNGLARKTCVMAVCRQRSCVAMPCMQCERVVCVRWWQTWTVQRWALPMLGVCVCVHVSGRAVCKLRRRKKNARKQTVDPCCWKLSGVTVCGMHDAYVDGCVCGKERRLQPLQVRLNHVAKNGVCCCVVTRFALLPAVKKTDVKSSHFFDHRAGPSFGAT
jgi:hypothetical protein